VHAEVAELQVLLEGVSLPASKGELIRYAREQDGAGRALSLLERLPDREYRRLDDVGEALAPAQPSAAQEAELPHEESGLPPGRDDYVNPHSKPGKVRADAPPDNPPQQVIKRQAEAQQTQKKRQEKLLD
jgi:Protein of unknown function (DUF2795)